MRYKDMTPDQKREYHRRSALAYARNHTAEKRTYQRAWVVANREKWLATKRAWTKANPDKVFEMKRRYRKKHAAKIKAKNQRYQEANREKTRAWSRKHYKKSYASNPEKWINYSAARRAKIGGAKLTRNLAKRLLVTQHGLCAICKTDLADSGYHRDHIIPLSKGGKHEDGNIQLLCPPCNLSKFNKTPHV